MKSVEVKVRPLPTPSDKSGGTIKAASRVYVGKDVILELTGSLDSGKPCTIEKTVDGQSTQKDATLWVAQDPKLGRGVVQISKFFQEACSLKLGDVVKVIYSNGTSVPDAEEVLLDDVTAEMPAIALDRQHHWEWHLEGCLNVAEDVFPGLILKNIYMRGQTRIFKIISVNGQANCNARFHLDKTQVRLAQRGAEQLQVDAPAQPKDLQLTIMAELAQQIEEINSFLRDFQEPFLHQEESRSCGMVIDGGHGTGKTMLLKQIAETGWGAVHKVQPADKLSSIQETFQKAFDQRPSLILIDDIEKLVEKDRSNRNAVIQTIGTWLDKLSEEAGQKQELPKVAVIATCQDHIIDIPPDLLGLERFNEVVTLPLPDLGRRRAILSSLNLPIHPEEKEELLNSLSQNTHAYNGTDLRRLVHIALKSWKDRLRRTKRVIPEDRSAFYIPSACLVESLQKIRPAAMLDISLKPPPVHWSDIGGQDEVKAALQLAVQMATEPKEVLEERNVSPPKGVLLYGPPGCSKTMAAQALATESGLNFFAVKGAELLNMYVGESERAIRRLFQRARDAAPSIIFFDEIDSIGGQRHGFGGGNSSASSGSGLNVLTTLLNEMQGFELTQGVLVIAATNRPQALDPALLRAGRFDKRAYVSPPNTAAREAIFRTQAARKKMDVDITELAVATEGHSGAEIVRICEEAAMAAYVRDYPDGSRKTNGMTSAGSYIGMDDMKKAIEKEAKLITEEMVRAYKDWEESFKK